MDQQKMTKRKYLTPYADFNDLLVIKEKDKEQYTLRAFTSTAKVFLRSVDSVFPPLGRKSDIWRNNNLLLDKIVIKCIYCFSIRKVYRNGRIRGKQKYHCQDCLKQFTEDKIHG